MLETFEKMLHEHKPVLAAFYSAGKEAQTDAEAIMGNVEKKFGSDLEYAFVDCSRHDSLRKKYQVDNYPTFILFKKHEELWRGNTHHADVIIDSIESFVR